MAMKLTPAAKPSPKHALADSAGHHDLDRQRLRILRCTAQAMASSPGGLRFKAGSQPWLDGIAPADTGFRQASRPQPKAALQGACAGL
jgi:hypothetical protein